MLAVVLGAPLALVLAAAAAPREDGGADDRAADDEQCAGAVRRADAHACLPHPAATSAAAASLHLLSRPSRHTKITTTTSHKHELIATTTPLARN